MFFAIPGIPLAVAASARPQPPAPMQPTSQLAGAQLAYWTARADGIAAEKLHLQQVPRTDQIICVLTHNGVLTAYDPIANPLIATPILQREQFGLAFLLGEWCAFHPKRDANCVQITRRYCPDGGWITAARHHADGRGPDLATAAMRALVAKRFGNEVPVILLSDTGAASSAEGSNIRGT